MIQGKTEAESVRLTARALGVDEDTARFIIAIERGEIDGDIDYSPDLTEKQIRDTGLKTQITD